MKKWNVPLMGGVFGGVHDLEVTGRVVVEAEDAAAARVLADKWLTKAHHNGEILPDDGLELEISDGAEISPNEDDDEAVCAADFVRAD